MIEVKMYLYDAQEIALMSQFEAILTQKRAQAGEAVVPGANTEPNATPPSPAPTSPLTTAHVEAPASDAVLMNAPAPAVVEVDDVTIQRTITAYGQKHGVPATVAKMQELFGVSQASKVPAERRADFVEAFRV